MAGLKPFDESSPAYRGMLGALWPRGPIWDPTQPGVAGLTAGFALEATRFHNRLVALMREAFPATADELLSEWEDAYGLPLCTAPETDDGRRLALAGRVAAQGGQSRPYYIALAWAVLEADGEYSRVDDPEGVWIEERPFGSPFVAWGSAAWEAGSPSAAVFYWILHLPAGVSEVKTDIIECLLCRFKPAHTVLVRDDASVVCETPGEPETPSQVGFFYHFPGSGTDDVALADIGAIEHQTIMFWMRVIGADEGGNLLEVQNDYGETYEVYLAAGGNFILELTVSNASFDGTSGASDPIAYDAWDFYSVEITPGLGSEGGGVGRMYRNAVEILETTGTPFEGGARVRWRDGGSIKFQGINLNVVDVANIKTMNRVLTSAERASLYAAGPQHDYSVATGDWAGDNSGIRWRDADVAGSVENSGTAGAADLVLAGDTTSEAF